MGNATDDTTRRTIDQQTCDHVLGYWKELGDASLVYHSDLHHSSGFDVIFNFCPLCGARLETR